MLHGITLEICEVFASRDADLSSCIWRHTKHVGPSERVPENSKNKNNSMVDNKTLSLCDMSGLYFKGFRFEFLLAQETQNTWDHKSVPQDPKTRIWSILHVSTPRTTLHPTAQHILWMLHWEALCWQRNFLITHEDHQSENSCQLTLDYLQARKIPVIPIESIGRPPILKPSDELSSQRAFRSADASCGQNPWTPEPLRHVVGVVVQPPLGVSKALHCFCLRCMNWFKQTRRSQNCQELKHTD